MFFFDFSDEIGRYKCAQFGRKSPESIAIRAPLGGAEEGTSMKIATAGKIRSIDWAKSGIAGTGSLSPRARRTLAVYVVLVKMDFSGVSAPMGAIADAIYRSSHGEAGSIRTLQRANTELEERGYIRRSCRGTVIWFNLDAFAYWTQRRAGVVSPLPTSAHNVVSRETKCEENLHTTSCRTSDVTTHRSRVTSDNTPLNSNDKQRAGARADDTHDINATRNVASRSPRKRKNAMLFSLGCVLGTLSEIHPADRRAARARAQCEVQALAGGVELLNPSGVDWKYWRDRWEEMAISARESTIRREILPLLLGRPTPPSPAELTITNPPAPELPAEPAATPEEIRAIREALEEGVTLPEESAPAPAPYPEIDADDPEMRVLLEARDRCRRARVNGW